MELQNLMNVQALVDFDPNGINKLYKLNLANKFMNVKAENPSLNQDQICKMLGTSSSTMKRIRTDLKLNSPYRYDIPLKHNKKKNTAPEEKSRETEKPKEKVKPKKKEKKEEIGLGKEEVNENPVKLRTTNQEGEFDPNKLIQSLIKNKAEN